MGMAKSTSSARRPSAGLQVVRNGSSATVLKPRIIHTYSPKVYKIKPEEFLDLVQKLTGRAEDVDADSPTTSASQDNVDVNSRLEDHQHEADSVGTPVSTQLLASLPSPRFVTLNFLPMLAATPSAFTQSRRDSGSFSFPSAHAY